MIRIIYLRVSLLVLLLFTVLVTACDIKNSSDNSKKTLMPGVEAIGYGYDVIYGKYASMESRKAQVLRFDTFAEQDVVLDDETRTYDIPEAMEYTLLADVASTFTCKNDFTEYRKDLATKASLDGSYGGFKASADYSYSSSIQQSTSSWFSCLNDLIRKYALRLSGNSNEELKGMRTSEFIADINAVTTDEDVRRLFEKYGTHVLLNCVVGGRVSYTSTVSTTQISEESKVGAAVKASYKNLTGSVGVSVEGNVDEATANSQYVANTQFYAVGGMGEYAIYLNGGACDKNNYEQWVQSIKYQPVLVDYYGDSSLKPIWELSDDYDSTPESNGPIASMIENYFHEYAADGGSLSSGLEIHIEVAGMYPVRKEPNLKYYWNIGVKEYNSTDAERKIAYLLKYCWVDLTVGVPLWAPYPNTGFYIKGYTPLSCCNSLSEGNWGDTMGGATFIVPRYPNKGIRIRVGTYDYDVDGSTDCLACDDLLDVLYSNGAFICNAYDDGSEKTVAGVDQYATAVPWVIPVGAVDMPCYFFTKDKDEGDVIVIFEISVSDADLP